MNGGLGFTDQSPAAAWIGVAKPGGLQPDQYLAGGRLRDGKFPDLELGAQFRDYRGLHGPHVSFSYLGIAGWLSRDRIPDTCLPPHHVISTSWFTVTGRAIGPF